MRRNCGFIRNMSSRKYCQDRMKQRYKRVLSVGFEKIRNILATKIG